VLRKLCLSKGEEVTGGRGKVYDEEPQDLYYSGDPKNGSGGQDIQHACW
jgi:hypothetical protein